MQTDTYPTEAVGTRENARPEWLTFPELCQMLRVSRTTALGLIDRGLPCHRLTPKMRRFNVGEVQTWLARQKA